MSLEHVIGIAHQLAHVPTLQRGPCANDSAAAIPVTQPPPCLARRCSDSSRPADSGGWPWLAFGGPWVVLVERDSGSRALIASFLWFPWGAKFPRVKNFAVRCFPLIVVLSLPSSIFNPSLHPLHPSSPSSFSDLVPSPLLLSLFLLVYPNPFHNACLALLQSCTLHPLSLRASRSETRLLLTCAFFAASPSIPPGRPVGCLLQGSSRLQVCSL